MVTLKLKGLLNLKEVLLVPKIQVDVNAAEDSIIYSVKAVQGLKDKAEAIKFIINSFGEQRGK